MKICYQEKRFNRETENIIGHADAIVTEYTEAGYPVTLRQLYYQFVARGILANNERNYKRLGSIVADARMAGLIDWDAVVDRTRSCRTHATWDSPAGVIQAAADGYAIDLWANQPRQVEVWVEKDALVDVIARPCNEWQVPYFSCRGYASQSALYEAGVRIGAYCKPTIVIHLGDHDPSGVDMTRDVDERMAIFATNVFVERIALTMEQIREFNPPPNPAKMSDARATQYVERFGEESWELDALEPRYLHDLISDSIKRHVDAKRWNVSMRRWKKERVELHEIADKLNREKRR